MIFVLLCLSRTFYHQKWSVLYPSCFFPCRLYDSLEYALTGFSASVCPQEMALHINQKNQWLLRSCPLYLRAFAFVAASPEAYNQFVLYCQVVTSATQPSHKQMWMWWAEIYPFDKWGVMFEWELHVCSVHWLTSCCEGDFCFLMLPPGFRNSQVNTWMTGTPKYAWHLPLGDLLRSLKARYVYRF